MKIVKHFVNFGMFFLFALLIVAPFGFSKIGVDKSVLGQQIQLDYHKKIVGSNSNFMVRNLTKETGQEVDFVTVLFDDQNTISYYPIYEISNLSDSKQDFSIHSSRDVVGNMEGKKVSLATDKGVRTLLFSDSNSANQYSVLNFTLNPEEKIKVNLIVGQEENVQGNGPISFDLIFKKR